MTTFARSARPTWKQGFVATRCSTRAMAFVVLAFWLSGCAVHQSQLAEVATPVPESYAEEQGPVTAREWPQDRWWERFEDPILNDLMTEAFAGNLDLEQAFARLDRFLAVTRITKAAELPAVDAGGQMGREHRPGIMDDETTNDYRISASAGYEVDLWRKLDSRSRAAEFESRATREDLLALYLTLSARIADLYYVAVEQRAQIELTDRTIASFEDAVQRVERRYRAGLVPSLDVYQARQNLAAAKSRRPPFEANLAEVQHALAVLLGRLPERPPEGAVAEIPQTPAPPPAGLPSVLVTRRPDVRAAFSRLEASDARVAAAVADRFPSFNLSAALGSSRTVLEAGTATGLFWNLLAGVTQPIFDAGRRKAEVERNESEFREIAATYRRTVLVAFREVEDALSGNRTSEERIIRLEDQVHASEASLRAAGDRYLRGLSDYLPVLTAQALHFDAQSQLLAARSQLIADRISLVRALGGDWMQDEMDERLGHRTERAPGAERM